MILSSPPEFVPLVDEALIVAPSVLYYWWLQEQGEDAARVLLEGKAMGTAKELDLVLLDLDSTIKHVSDPKGYAGERKKGVTVGKRALKKTKESLLPTMMTWINGYTKGGLDEKQLRKNLTRRMKEAWRDVFLAGIRASGVPGKGSGGALGQKTPLVKLTDPNDEKWLKSAMQHEMRYFNKFMRAIVDDAWTMPLRQRAGMYVDTLDAFYETARVIGLPATSRITWTGKRDPKTCPGCQYLFDNNAYWKGSLPTVPRAGLTQCLTNCRDRLLIRIVSGEKVQALAHGAKQRGHHIRKLREIKRTGKYKTTNPTFAGVS